MTATEPTAMAARTAASWSAAMASLTPMKRATMATTMTTTAARRRAVLRAAVMASHVPICPSNTATVRLATMATPTTRMDVSTIVHPRAAVTVARGSNIRSRGLQDCDDGTPSTRMTVRQHAEPPGAGMAYYTGEEVCDDGNDDETDGCRGCDVPRCGDGVVDVIDGEAYDGGGDRDANLCQPLAQLVWWSWLRRASWMEPSSAAMDWKSTSGC